MNSSLTKCIYVSSRLVLVSISLVVLLSLSLILLSLFWRPPEERGRRGGSVGDREVGPPADPPAASAAPPVTGRDPPARQTTTEETFLIERIPVRFVVVILVLPSERRGRRAARWIPLHLPPSRASRPGRGRRSRVVGAVTVCLFGGRKENTRGISIPPHSIESNPLRVRGPGGMDGWMKGSGRSSSGR